MITEYFRPKTLEEAHALILRKEPPTYALGGGTKLHRRKEERFAVVDLQGLNLQRVNLGKVDLKIGAMTTLQELCDHEGVYPDLRKAITHEASKNIRQTSTIAGSLISCYGRSPFITTMLALEAKLWFYPDEGPVALGELLPHPEGITRGRLVTEVTIPTNLKFSYQYVSRTPADLPIVCVGVARWPSGRTRVALGGYGKSPILVFDGPDGIGADIAARDAYLGAGDSWAGAQYRSEMAAILAKRSLEMVQP